MTSKEKTTPENSVAEKTEKTEKVEKAQKAKADKMKDRIKVLITNVLVFIFLVGGFFWLVRNYFHLGSDNFTNSAQVEGFVNPINTRISGYIKEIRFIEHQEVSSGDTLVILDDSEVRIQLAQAEAAYMNALAAKHVTSSAVNTAANNVHTTQANIAGAKARLENAERNLQRYENLLRSEAVTRFQYDQVKTEYDMSKSAYEALINQRQTADLTTEEVKSRLALNDAEIKRAEAVLEMAKLNLSYTVITAPYDGIMGRRLIQEGQLLQQPGMQAATIVTYNNKWVTANFLESQMPNISIGQRVKMKVDALGGAEFEGMVTAISAATGARFSNVPTDNSTGNFVKVQKRIPVRIEFTDKDSEAYHRLRVGMNTDVFIKK
jgi:membrane fusion protein (multidrug efflux system)